MGFDAVDTKGEDHGVRNDSHQQHASRWTHLFHPQPRLARLDARNPRRTTNFRARAFEEAELMEGGKRLGPMGSQIVGEVFAGLKPCRSI
jgi:hypothetical protein